MKKLYLALAMLLISFNANAFIISPHVGIDYAHSKLHGFDNINELNGATFSVGAKALGFLSVEGYYQKHFSTKASASSKTKPSAYGVDLVFDTLNLGVVELLTTVGYGKYSLDGGILDKDLNKFEGSSYRLGLGGQINPTDKIGIRAMYRYIFPEEKLFKKNVQELSIGIRYYFF